MVSSLNYAVVSISRQASQQAGLQTPATLVYLNDATDGTVVALNSTFCFEAIPLPSLLADIKMDITVNEPPQDMVAALNLINLIG